MKNLALSVSGISLFVAGYYHVHRHAAYTATRAAAVLETPAAPATQPPQKTLAVFASLPTKVFVNGKF
ncbi:hypothetical protein [Spirosoma jeollabukense]